MIQLDYKGEKIKLEGLEITAETEITQDKAREYYTLFKQTVDYGRTYFPSLESRTLKALQRYMPEVKVVTAYLTSAEVVDIVGKLEGADLRGLDLSGRKLARAPLRRADLSRANLSGTDLSSADLRQTYLQYAILREADLSKAVLRGADLYGADLCMANLVETDVREADLREANLMQAKYNDDTKWPKDFDPEGAQALRLTWKKPPTPRTQSGPPGWRR